MKRSASGSLIQYFIAMGALLLGSLAQPKLAHSDLRGDCEDALQGRIDIVSMDAQDDRGALNRENLEEVVRIAHMLGLNVPPHIATFMRPGSLANFVKLGGRPPLPHDIDGAIISQPSQGGGRVLELVHPGCPTCRSFNDSWLTPRDQIQIDAHVIGHNDFFETSVFFRRLGADPVAAASRLSETISRLYQDIGHDEVSSFVRWVQGLDSLQDFALATLDTPESFRQAAASLTNENKRNPKLPSWSPLQALAAHARGNLPDWQAEILELYEEIKRPTPTIAATKIMNEGWAVFCQWMITAWSNWSDGDVLFDFAQLAAGALQANIGNPYWLGSQAWLRTWERFTAQDEVQAMEPLEKFRSFVEYAHELIRWSRDREFLTDALDETWIRRNHLYIGRPAVGDERVSGLPLQKDQEQYVVTSRDPERIKNSIIDALARHEFNAPRILIKSVGMPQQPEPRVVLEHDGFENMALDRKSLVAVLYHLANTMNRTVQIDTITAPHWKGGSEEPVQIRVRVTPGGSVIAKPIRNSEMSESKQNALQRGFTDLLDPYVGQFAPLFSTSSLITEDLQEESVSAVVDQRIGPAAGTVGYESGEALALLEYANTMKRYLPYALAAAFNGQADIDPTDSSFQVGGLPRPPALRFDKESVQKAIEAKGISPRDRPLVAWWMGGTPQGNEQSTSTASVSDERHNRDGVISGGGQQIGDIFVGPKNQGGGGGGGGSGEGQPGEGQPQEGPGSDAGADGSQMFPLEIPIEIYGQYLANQIEIPNLEPRGGEANEEDWVHEGQVRRPYGEIRHLPTAKRVIAKAIAMRVAAGESWQDIPPSELFREGLQYFSRNDIYVEDRVQQDVPEMSLVIVIAVDFTGSMQPRGVRKARKIALNLRAMLQAKYPHAVFRFVGFNTKWEEYDWEGFQSASGEGGTKYSVAFSAMGEVLEEYGPEYNKVGVVIGDWENFNTADSAAMLEILAEFYDDLAFLAAFQTTTSGSAKAYDELVGVYGGDSHFGHAIIPIKQENVRDAMLEVFGKEEQQESERQ